MQLHCDNCGVGEEFVATSIFYLEIKVSPDGWPTEDHDDLENSRQPTGDVAVAYSCLRCNKGPSPIYDDEEERASFVGELMSVVNAENLSQPTI